MISIIIPAYNEEERIGYCLNDLILFLNENEIDAEIIIVNDGSIDKTSEVANSFKERARIKVIDLKKNKGKGCAVKTGVAVAMGEVIVFLDADGSTDVNHLKELMDKISNGYDVVIGSRSKEESKIVKKQFVVRSFSGKSFNLLIRDIFRLSEFKDTQCGFKGFEREAAKDIFSKLTVDRFAFDVEVMAISKISNYMVYEIPVVWMNKEKSRVNFISAIIMFFDLIKIRYNLIVNKYKE
jgi:dolichyl-phosphate beta-glucosyltransferase